MQLSFNYDPEKYSFEDTIWFDRGRNVFNKIFYKIKQLLKNGIDTK